MTDYVLLKLSSRISDYGEEILDHLRLSFQQQRYLVRPYGGIGVWVPSATYR